MFCFFNILFLMFGVLVATMCSIAPSSVIKVYYSHFTNLIIWTA